MSRRALAGLVLVAMLMVPAPALAWGFDVHRYITDRAIDLLPDEMRPFFDKHRSFVVERSIDPDLWRVAGFTDEPPRHFVDLDAYGEYPFPKLSREYEENVARFGEEFVVKNGTLPWRLEEMHGRLVKAFTEQKEGTSPYALDNARFLAAVVAHYIADAHVPFHAVLNYDGQLTNQRGIHSRFETELFARYRSRLTISPTPIRPVTTPRDFAFDTLRDSFRQAEALFAADLEALGDGEVYDDPYFDRFFEKTRPVLEGRMSRAIAAVAALVTGAWEEAGRPELPLEPPPRAPRKRPAP
jgi:hypothetical protein